MQASKSPVSLIFNFTFLEENLHNSNGSKLHLELNKLPDSQSHLSNHQRHQHSFFNSARNSTRRSILDVRNKFGKV
jgi:hypothetical protein